MLQRALLAKWQQNDPMRWHLLLAGLFLTACQPQGQGSIPFGTYMGAETRLMGGELVNFNVKMSGNLNRRALLDYAECVAAQYTLIRGYDFARHLRTNVHQTSGNWEADAVYTISPTIPQGVRTIEAAVTVESCQERGIPTV